MKKYWPMLFYCCANVAQVLSLHWARSTLLRHLVCHRALSKTLVHLSVLVSYGISVALITAALVYLLAMIIIIGFSTQFAISKKVTLPWVWLLE